MKASHELGVTRHQETYTFCLLAKADSVTLNLFEKGASSAHLTLVMQAQEEDTWIATCDHLPDTFEYTYTLNRDSHKVDVLDPYARHITSPNHFREKQTKPLRSCYKAPTPFDWELDAHPLTPMEKTVVYEAHIRGFTQHTSSNAKHESAFLNLIDKIPHLKKLGITTLELLPLFEFDETEHPGKNDEINLCNFWGYSTRSFFSLMHRYGSSAEKALTEFKQMVKALHKAGIELILDVVFNHTDEGSLARGFHNFSALNKEAYFILSNGSHTNYSGCGNTFSSNTSAGIHLILNSLRYWVKECRVDGFRFDLASILYRGPDGDVLERPAIIEAISKDPILSKAKFFVEPWDAAGLYQLGSFGNYRFCEWNDKFRDHVRDFLRGQGSKHDFINRLLGSGDIWPTLAPLKSLNYITVHDGFSLFDVCAFSEKCNWDNGEENRDGSNDNKSWNCGEEGLDVSAGTRALRLRQMKNFLLALFCSRGVPLLLMGDEYGHTKKGNNNTYCHDNELNYFLWDKLKQQPGLCDFISTLTSFRNSSHFQNEAKATDLIKDQAHVLYLLYENRTALIFNAQQDPLLFTLPKEAKSADVIASSDTHLCSLLQADVEYTLAPFSSALFTYEKR